MNENLNEEKNISWTDVCRKIVTTFSSMRFSFLLLFLLLVACLIGSIIPQQAGEAAYVQQYGETGAKVLQFLRIDHVFTAWWFIFLTGLLCMNLVLCSISRFPALWRVWNQTGRKSIGLWGSWITHLGMLLLVVTFALSQWTAKEYVVYGIPGSTQPIGETGYYLTIDSFETKLRDDFTVEQYEAALTVTDENGTALSGMSSVNYPFSAFGYTLYQDSTGWAEYCDIYEDGELIKTDLLCTGEYTYPDELPALCLMFYKFYPDFTENSDGSYYSETPLLNNPKSLYCLYYDGQLMKMDFAAPEEEIDGMLYQFVLRDPIQYTLIVIKSDPLAKFVAIAALILLIGLFISFYIKPMEVKKRQEAAAGSLDQPPADLSEGQVPESADREEEDSETMQNHRQGRRDDAENSDVAETDTNSDCDTLSECDLNPECDLNSECDMNSKREGKLLCDAGEER